jgi:ABC-type amino acid transport system permease subunit
MLKAQRRKQFIDVFSGDQLVTSCDYVKQSPFSLDGQDYTVKATSLLGVSFSLCRGDEVVIVEKTTALLANTQQVEHDGRTWLMKPASFFGRKFSVMSDGGATVGTIAPGSWFSPLSGITVDLSDDVPMLVQVFMLWLAVRYWTMDSGNVT